MFFFPVKYQSLKILYLKKNQECDSFFKSKKNRIGFFILFLMIDTSLT
jgi:hypothetical protein